MSEITEYRGVEGLVYAEVLADDENAYTTGTVKSLAGVAEISKTTDSSTESHYYDNIPAIVITSAGADTLTCTVSAIPLDVLADITGQVWDSTKGAYIEGNRQTKYFALGYKTKKTNGDEIYVWRLKGTFGVPDQVNHTENESTDANSQELIYTGVSTMHKFTATGKGCKALNVDTSLELANVSTFFDVVTTPDSLQARV
jgi:phi13 family phage major tail protein